MLRVSSSSLDSISCLPLQLVSRDKYEHFLERRLAVAESRTQNSYHCQTADCLGWCIYEDDVNEFRCPICWALNCLVCKVSQERPPGRGSCSSIDQWVGGRWWSQSQDTRPDGQGGIALSSRVGALRSPIPIPCPVTGCCFFSSLFQPLPPNSALKLLSRSLALSLTYLAGLDQSSATENLFRLAGGGGALVQSPASDA